MNVIQKVREYILTCPYLKEFGDTVGINFTGNGVDTFSLDMNEENSSVASEWIDGSGESRILYFDFTCLFFYSDELSQQIENMDFFFKFRDWLRKNSNNGNLPKLGIDDENNNFISTNIEAISDGILKGVNYDVTKGLYCIKCLFEYDVEFKN